MLRNIWFSGLLASCVLHSAPAFSALDATHPKPAQTIGYKDESGAAHTLAPKDNKLTAVHFWATWCVPCVKELPEVDAAQAAYAAKGFKVIALSLDGDNSAPKVKKFFAEHGIKQLPIALDPGNAAFMKAELKGLPSTLFIDADGKEIARAEGALDWKNAAVTAFLESKLK